MFEFIFGNKSKKDSKFVGVYSQKKEVFLVVHKNTQAALGVFDNLEKAKEMGRKSTYCTCDIYKFGLNDACKYLHTLVYSDE